MEANDGSKDISIDEAEKAAATIIGKLDDAGDMEFGYSEFIAICVDDDEKENNYLGFYRIDRNMGIFNQEIPDDIRSCLTSTEASLLSEHPLKDLNSPILPFPFTAAQLKAFMQWSANRGIEIPVDGEALDEAIANNQQEEAQAAVLRQHSQRIGHDITTNESDASLGAYYRHQHKKLAERSHEEQIAREKEWQHWRNTAEKIRQGRQRPVSKRVLARLVKEHLRLPDAIETIRKRL
jgi:hypothetical protein